jgi:beta-lactamase regulating signal transducer with metallopeptidase domain
MPTLLDIGLANAVLATVLAIIVAVVTCFWRRPALTHSLWLLVLLKLLTPAIVTVPLFAWLSRGEATAETSSPATADSVAAARDGAETLATPAELPSAQELEALLASLQEQRVAIRETAAEPISSASWREPLAVAWLAGSLLWLAWTGVAVWRFNRLLRRAQPGPAWLRDLVRELSKELGMRRPPRVCLLPGTLSPMVWAMGPAPRLLFPAQLLDRIDREQLATLLVHELAHLRRRDHWVRFVELAALVLYWWHPVVWWARRELHEAEEQCCDSWVVWARPGASETYADALLQTIAFLTKARSPLPVMASGIGQVPQLRRRLTMILQGKTAHSLSWAGCLAVLGIGLLLPFVPAYGQAPSNSKPAAQAQKDGVDQEIAALKDRLRMLEAQRQKSAPDTNVDRETEISKALGQYKRALPLQQKLPRSDYVAQEADTQKLQAAAAELARAMEVKRKELADLEARYAQIVAQLKGGKTVDPGLMRARKAQAAEEQARAEDALLKAKMEKAKALDLDEQARAKAALEKAEWERRMKEKGYMPARPKEDVEQKLDRLLKEMDELKREIQRNKTQPNKSGSP